LARILILVSEATWPSGAGLTSNVRINAELQAERMDIVGQCFDPGREPLRIGDDVAALVTRNLPAVVDYNVLVARVFHAGFHHGIGGLAD
jgi:hypothetical protein